MKDVKRYFATNGTVSKWWNPEGVAKFHYEKELKILEENFEINPKWKVLDVGTGKGRFAIWFAKKGCDVTALDINKEILNVAKQNAKEKKVYDKIEFILGDAENLCLNDNEFDVVCCIETFDHIPNIEKAVSEMINVIKVGGQYLFTFLPETSFYWKIVTIRDKLSALSDKLTIARAYPFDFVYRILEVREVKIEKSWGVSLLYPIKIGFIALIPILISKFEKGIKPYYSSPLFVRRCTHIVTVARKTGVLKKQRRKKFGNMTLAGMIQ